MSGLFLTLCSYSARALKRQSRLLRLKRFAMIVVCEGIPAQIVPNLAPEIISTFEPVAIGFAPILVSLGSFAIAQLAGALHDINEEYAAVREGLAAAREQSRWSSAT